jgi:uncharacterized protein (DUF433 family)
VKSDGPSDNKAQVVELGEHIVVDPAICHGKPTYRGTRIMVWQVLCDLEHGESIPKIVATWGGRVSKAAVLETIRLAHGAFLNSSGKLHRNYRARLAA